MDVTYDADGHASLRCRPTEAQTLTVDLIGSGTGSVTSSPASIDCPDTCSAAFPIDSIVELTPKPDAGQTFAEWGGDCSGDGAVCTVTMSHARNVTAKFRDLETLLLTIENDCPIGLTCSPGWHGGSIVVRDAGTGETLFTCSRNSFNDILYTLEHGCHVPIDHGREVTLSPQFGSNSSYFFGFTSPDYGPCDQKLDCTLVMTGPAHVEATFG